MRALTLALAATAIAATSGTFASTAEAGGGLRFHLMQMQHARNFYRHNHRDDDDDGYYVRRKRVIVTKPAPQQVQKPVEKAAVVKLVDGEGRQFDQVSKTWFDGKGVCWKGDKAFAFKSGSWFYGNARWIETSAGWGVASGQAPEQVACDGIKAFEAKLNGNNNVAVAKPVEAKKVETAKAEVAEKPAVSTATTGATAKAGECKKYFPSVGEMVSVPCGE